MDAAEIAAASRVTSSQLASGVPEGVGLNRSGGPPKLTIGLPVYDDYDGVVFTVQALRMYQQLAGVAGGVEIVVVDNQPSDDVRDFLNGCADSAVRYVAWPNHHGPAAAKNQVFQAAQGEIVLCLDAHVLLHAQSIGALLDFFARRPDCNDLVTGPLVYDDLSNQSTHFAPVWRGEMWGIWDRDARGDVFLAEPFPIWGNGCGLFACRREAWLSHGGFHPLWRGFGGEEGYIHEKFRQAGHQVWCLPALRWWHRFGRPKGIPYPGLTRWNKLRNYVLGHLELGLALDPIREHFVDSGLVPRLEWESLLDNPARELPPQEVIDAVNGVVNSKASHAQHDSTDSIASIYELVRSRPRDLEQHMPKLRELASQCAHVTDLSHRRESLIALAAGAPQVLVSHNTEAHDEMAQRVARLRSITLDRLTSRQLGGIEPTDLLFIDSFHTYQDLRRELFAYGPSVSRYIVMHDTEVYGRQDEPDGTRNSGAGLIAAMRDFLLAHREAGWFVAFHTSTQHGLTVLSKNPDDRLRDEQGEPVKIRLWAKECGPGTELKNMLKSLGIEPNASCDCNGKAMQMDAWGVAGCREHFDEIVAWIKENHVRWGWGEHFGAGVKAIASGMFLRLSLTDPFGSLVREAIRRAEAHGPCADEDF